MTMTKNGRRKALAMRCGIGSAEGQRIKAKIARVGEWKFKTKKSSGKQAPAPPKKDGKKPKKGRE